MDLWKVLAGTEEGRQDKDQITIFDSVGFALEDYSTLRYVYQQALLRNVGFADVFTRRDLAGQPRVSGGRWLGDGRK